MSHYSLLWVFRPGIAEYGCQNNPPRPHRDIAADGGAELQSGYALLPFRPPIRNPSFPYKVTLRY